MTTDLGKGALDPDSAHPFRGEAELAAPARPLSSLNSYEPAAIIERVTPRYSVVPHGLARVSGDLLLAQIAMDAAALWRCAPGTVDAQPLESEVIIRIDFHLPD